MSSPLSASDRRRRWIRIAILGFGYFLSGRLGLELPFSSPHITLLWLPTGIAVAALYRWGFGCWPGVAIGALAVVLSRGGSPAFAIGVAIGNTLGPCFGVWLMRRSGFDRRFLEARDIAVFVLCGALAGSLLSAIGGALQLLLWTGLPGERFDDALLSWWLGDAVGVLIGALPWLTWGTARPASASGRLHWLELAVAVTLALGMSAAPLLGIDRAVDFALMPAVVVVWVVFRFGIGLASWLVLLMAMLGALELSLATRGLTAELAEQQLVWLWTHVVGLAAAAMLVSALNAGRERAMHELQESEQRFRIQIENAPEAVVVFDVDSGHFVDANRNAERLFGLTREQLLQRSPLDVSPPQQPDGGDSASLAANHVGLALHGDTTVFEWMHRDAAGRDIPCEVRLARLPKAGRRWVRGSLTDIGERKAAQHLVWRQAHFDSLTGLANRHMLRERLQQQLAAASPLALMFIDLDGFKEVNDTLGHDAGDQLLVEAGRRLAQVASADDLAGRLGGDEFTVLLAAAPGEARVEAVAEAVLETLAAPFLIDGQHAYISASIGISRFPDDAGDVSDLFRHADEALYAAKELGRNRYCHFNAELQAATAGRVRLARELRSALATTPPFRLHYQPIVELRGGRVHKVEALLRWTHPQLGELNPAEFIAVAESIGVIAQVGDWVFSEAVAQAARWRGQLDPDFQVAVNVSPAQFRGRGLPLEHWLTQMSALGLPGSGVVLEITEGVLLDASDAVRSTLQRIRAAGLRISIDDFGTGYSSLSYLQRHAIDLIKIDQSFVRELDHDPRARSLCKAIIAMAHELQLQVVAEGVETVAQHALLVDAGCDYAQGYLFARPLPADELAHAIAAIESRRPGG